MTLIIMTGEIDLSVASTMGLSAVVMAMLHFEAGWSVPAAAAVAVVVGTLCGAVNGFLVAYVGLPSLAVTIGTLALFRGIAVGLTGTTQYTGFPQEWRDLALDRISEGSTVPAGPRPDRHPGLPLPRPPALHDLRPRRLRDRPER